MFSPSFLVLAVAVSTMHVLTFALPSILLSQLTEAVPGWTAPGFGMKDTLFDPDRNKLGAVASENSICSNIGIDMLKAGGNAADTLVATTLCVGVIGMYHR